MCNETVVFNCLDVGAICNLVPFVSVCSISSIASVSLLFDMKLYVLIVGWGR